MTITDYWAIPRPKTKHWGSGAVWTRMLNVVGTPDVAFGKTDGIPQTILAVDLVGHPSVRANWNALPFENSHFEFGYWDPPYDHLYKQEGREIWRVCRRLAILHTHCYPTSWFEGANRTAHIAISMGPLKQMRALQVFDKTTPMPLRWQLLWPEVFDSRFD